MCYQDDTQLRENQASKGKENGHYIGIDENGRELATTVFSLQAPGKYRVWRKCR